MTNFAGVDTVVWWDIYGRIAAKNPSLSTLSRYRVTQQVYDTLDELGAIKHLRWLHDRLHRLSTPNYKFDCSETDSALIKHAIATSPYKTLVEALKMRWPVEYSELLTEQEQVAAIVRSAKLRQRVRDTQRHRLLGQQIREV